MLHPTSVRGATTNLGPNAIVTELLTKSNYENWKVCLEGYFLSKDLWDIVDGTETKPESTQAEFRTWRKNNAKALHAIRISCGPEMFSYIKKMDSAKAAWDHLASKHQEENQEKQLSSGTKPGYKEHENQKTQMSSRTKPDYTYQETSERTHLDNAWYQPLYKALYNGDWYSAKSFIDLHPDVLSTGLTEYGDTALHIAVAFGQVQVVQELVSLMAAKALELKNLHGEGETAFSMAAAGGIKEIAEVMVRKNDNLVCIQNQSKLIPIVIACINGNKDMVHYLYAVTPAVELSPETSTNGATLLTNAIIGDFYDVALDLLRRYPRLATAPDTCGNTAVNVLAGRPSAFPSGSHYGIWQRWIYSCIQVQPTIAFDYSEDRENLHESSTERVHSITQVLIHRLHGLFWSALKLLGIKQIHDTKLIHNQATELLKLICSEVQPLNRWKLKEARVYEAIFRATMWGIPEFIVEIINSKLDLITTFDENGRGIIQAAVVYRQEKIFNLLYEIGEKNLTEIKLDKFKNNMLHLAGMLGPSSQLDRISGAALQMQRELQWFQEVDKVLPTIYKGDINFQGKTPQALFTEEHRSLVKEGEKWMKETSQACMIVATLIATVMFAATFTVPGGNNGDTGFPIFLQDKSFLFFIVSDALSLFSSCTSVLMFLAILTSRYAEQDFLKSLPKRLIIGLATLFFSIATMMAAFGATLVIVLHERVAGVAVPVILLGSVPVTLFALLQFPLFIDIVCSTYGSGIFRRQAKCMRS